MAERVEEGRRVSIDFVPFKNTTRMLCAWVRGPVCALHPERPMPVRLTLQLATATGPCHASVQH